MPEWRMLIFVRLNDDHGVTRYPQTGASLTQTSLNCLRVSILELQNGRMLYRKTLLKLILPNFLYSLIRMWRIFVAMRWETDGAITHDHLRMRITKLTERDVT
jgi:hypothetical protein